jgi:hypothetical protein
VRRVGPFLAPQILGGRGEKHIHYCIFSTAEEQGECPFLTKMFK